MPHRIRGWHVVVGLQLVALVALVAAGCGTGQPGRPGDVLDEAAKAGRPATSFPAAAEDYFHDMDGALPLSREEIQGRNMWIVWTGGNDRFWDTISVSSLGTFDLLKSVSSHPKLGYGRKNRFKFLGLINEPCYTEATGPDPNRYGLWLDVRDPKCPPDPFANEETYKGVMIGARGKTVPVGSYYGEPTGIVGLRLFPNPAFDEKARKRWNSERYYNDPAYYFSRDLVKPYRVGMSCGFCHVGPDPLRPPADPENPEWRNLSSTVGAQFFWVDRIFNWQAENNRDSYFKQLFQTSRPGSLDTSLVSTDNINNPRTMNAVYLVGPRLMLGKRWAREKLVGGELDNRQFNDFVPAGHPLAELFEKPDTVYTPRVLKDGSDSVGALGALNRVYLNIGLFSEEWLLHFRPIIGGVPITPIPIATAKKNSHYWQATEQQTMNMAAFLVKASGAHRLKDAPGGPAHLTADAATLQRGKEVFADYCARCHSSKLVDLPPDIKLEENGPGYLENWNKYWAHTQTPAFKQAMRAKVLDPAFLDDNYLSNELRVPVTLLGTNLCSPIATNAIAGNIWDNFSSSSYKSLPSVGTVKVRHPITGAERDFVVPGGGRGFTRPASLVSLWSTAPFLQNNTVGPFDPSPSVEARVKVFERSIEQMLWPEKRRRDAMFTDPNDPGGGVIDRSDVESSLTVPRGYLPGLLRPFISEDGITVGPFPKDFPVSLLANADLMGADITDDREKEEHERKVREVIKIVVREKKAGHDIFKSTDVMDGLWSLSKCPDLVVNKGHYFGTQWQPGETPLSDADKGALIAFLKTF
jgi:cytochrome c5